jgi:uncharacterized membrane protein (Fun14 family)
MQIPAELAWVFPTFIPFVIGLLVGAAIKRTLRLMMIIAALTIVLVATGYVSITFQEIYDKAMEFLPNLIETGEGLKDVLPYSSAGFLVGLGLGLWKG